MKMTMNRLSDDVSRLPKVESHWFGSFFLFMVVTNSILIGASLEMQAVQGEAFAGEEFLLGINTFYVAMFSIEAAMRLAAKGVLSYVWASQDWSWNWLDIFAPPKKSR